MKAKVEKNPCGPGGEPEPQGQIISSVGRKSHMTIFLHAVARNTRQHMHLAPCTDFFGRRRRYGPASALAFCKKWKRPASADRARELRQVGLAADPVPFAVKPFFHFGPRS